jgi:hypothetical protein
MPKKVLGLPPPSSFLGVDLSVQLVAPLLQQFIQNRILLLLVSIFQAFMYLLPLHCTSWRLR